MTCRPSWTTSPKIAAADTRASKTLAGAFPGEQARIIQFFIDRVEVGISGPKVRFQDKGLAHMVDEVRCVTSKSRKASAWPSSQSRSSGLTDIFYQAQ